MQLWCQSRPPAPCHKRLSAFAFELEPHHSRHQNIGSVRKRILSSADGSIDCAFNTKSIRVARNRSTSAPAPADVGAEAIFAVEQGSSVYEFHAQWSRSEQMGAIKNGSGDELFVHFTPAGCFIKGFAHESVMTPYRTNPLTHWPGLLSSVPLAFESSLKEPAFDIPATTFVVWRLAGDPRWHTDEIEFPDHYYGDGSQELLPRLLLTGSEFADWLAENYEVEVDADVVSDVFENRPLTDAQLRALNPSAAIAELRSAVQQTGYAIC